MQHSDYEPVGILCAVAYETKKWVSVKVTSPDLAISPHHAFKIRRSDLPTGPRGRNLRVGDVLDVPTTVPALRAARSVGSFVDIEGAILVEAS